jgi:hypothetical protein
MKRPNKFTIESWGGVFPPAVFKEMDVLLARSQFSFHKIGEDAALVWVRPCNDQLVGQVMLIVAPLYISGSDVVCATSLLFNSEKIKRMLIDASKSSSVPFESDFDHDAIEGRTNIACFRIDRYDSEIFGDGQYRPATLPLAQGMLKDASWALLYHRAVLPLIDTLSNNDSLIHLLDRTPSLVEARNGNTAWHSMASQLFAAFICFDMGKLHEAIRRTELRSADLLPYQLKDLDAARQYLVEIADKHQQ